MRKAIVTGANGFIGTALCRELSNQGISVIAVVRNVEENISNIENLSGLRVVYSDLSEFKNLHEKISDRDVDVLYHLAWVGSAGPLRGNAEVQFNNIRYTCDTVKACSKMNCKRFVFASSIMEYEIEAIMATDATPGLNTLYSSAKVSADYLARTIAGSLGVDYIRAVISNIYGPGELSPRLVNTSIRKLLNGEHCAFSAGEQTYDFIYIDDAAKTFVAIGEKGIANRTYYIGSQNPKPLKEFLCELRDQVDPNIGIGLGEIPFNGVSLTYNEFNVHAVKEDTGFVPTVSFAEGIRSTIKWIKEN
ncbi:MAG: NAD(P)-dependent oxidoreductase [Lachnospiraceae bacterium]|nr:NAD(P)-dependent oxidoreductase [Lachnospiraceae bacterium]